MLKQALIPPHDHLIVEYLMPRDVTIHVEIISTIEVSFALVDDFSKTHMLAGHATMYALIDGTARHHMRSTILRDSSGLQARKEWEVGPLAKWYLVINNNSPKNEMAHVGFQIVLEPNQ